jgi:hypothetical protein
MSDYQLIHPVYLDISMMMSFLAFIEGGVDTGGEETQTTGTVKEKREELGAKLKLPSISKFFEAEATAAASAGKTVEQTLEYTAVRQHTAASLFNSLHSYLHEDGKVQALSSVDQLSSLDIGQLVEVRGSYLGNPLEQIVEQGAAILGYLEESDTAPAPLDSAGIRIMLKMQRDLSNSPVRDALFMGSSGLQVVLAMDAQHFSPATGERLRAGVFTVIGKVTQVMITEGSVNLARRTVMGAVGSEVARKMVNDSSKAFTQLSTLDPTIHAPSVQILPMAIYV